MAYILVIRTAVALWVLLVGWYVYRHPVPRRKRLRRPFRWKQQPPPPQEKDDYPTLHTLIGGYFNQDCDIIYKTDDSDEIIAIVKKEGSSEALQNLIHDIQRFIAKYGQSDAELNDALKRVFRPDMDFYHDHGRGTREGLEHIIELLSVPPKTP